MHKICLTLPTNRACAAAISATAEEAAYAADHFDVEVYLLVLDSSSDSVLAEHIKVISEIPRTPNVAVLHLDEDAQRHFLHQVIHWAGVAQPDLIADLMLPAEVSYGACTNRAFLIGSALGCQSIHRRDSDSRYQVLEGASVFPIHHELSTLGRRAVDAADCVSETMLDPAHLDWPVMMVGGSFVGELSVDIGEIYQRNRDVYSDIVGLWAPAGWSDAQIAQLVDESFRGAGNDAFIYDFSILTVVDPMRVDMCNISFHQVHEHFPLPPATNTIGSDYFLIHLVHDAALPGVLHNRNIVNFHTGERKTHSGFMAYHLRLAKFFLSMLYFHFIYQRMAAAGESLLDERHRVSTSKIIEFVRESTGQGKEENMWRLDSLDRAYRKLGGRYAEFADLLLSCRERLLTEAQSDIEDFALLMEAWEPLVLASKATGVTRVRQ